MFQNFFNCAALIAISATAAVLFALAIAGNELDALNAQADLFQVTVVHKNQLHPRRGEIRARAARRHSNDEAKSIQRIVFERQGQWI